MQPLISICMLTYNHENFIKEAIKSVVGQTYLNWELIIVDNASTDNTRQYVEELVLGNEKIIFLPQIENLYVSRGINIAIEYAQGEYIAIFSGDDVFLPNKLELQVQFMQKKELDLSFTWIKTINDLSEKSESNIEKLFNIPECTTQYHILYQYFAMHNCTCATTAMFKKSLLSKVSLFDHRLLQTQDMAYWIDIFKETKKVEIQQKVLTNYRVRDGENNLSISSSPIKMNRSNFEMLYIWKKLFMINNQELSMIFQKTIDDDNKYEILYAYLKNNNVHIWQYAILMDIYQVLGSECDTQSSLFKLFFEEYGKFAMIPLNELINYQNTITNENRCWKYKFKNFIHKLRAIAIPNYYK